MSAHQRDMALTQEWVAHCGSPLCTQAVLRWRVREYSKLLTRVDVLGIDDSHLGTMSGQPRTRAILSSLARTWQSSCTCTPLFTLSVVVAQRPERRPRAELCSVHALSAQFNSMIDCVNALREKAVFGRIVGNVYHLFR